MNITAILFNHPPFIESIMLKKIIGLCMLGIKNINLISLIGILITITLVSGCNARGIMNLQSGNVFASQTWHNEDNSFTVPFVWHDGHIIIETKVNGAKSLRLALDSGASTTVLFETQRTKSLPLDIGREIKLRSSIVNVVNDVLIEIGDIKLAELTIIHVPIDQNPLFDSYEMAYFDGAIGFDILNHFNVTIHYAEKLVTFSRQDAHLDFIDDKWVTLPISIQGRIPYVDATMENSEGNLSQYSYVVDTGAPEYIYLNEKLAKGIEFPSVFVESQIQNFDGKHVIKTSRIKLFGLAGETFLDIAANDLPYFEDDYGVGLIGSGLLRKFDVHFNYRAGYMALHRNTLSNKTYIDQSGFVLEPHQLGGIVKHVSEDSHAAIIGIKVGSIVNRIQGITLNEENFDLLRNLFRSEVSTLMICWQNGSVNECSKLNLNNSLPL
jgi:hypothetical protein